MTGILLFVYWIINVIALGFFGNVFKDVDVKEDIKIKHLVFVITFLPATVIAFLTFLIIWIVLEVKDFLKRSKAFNWLNKPLFSKNEQE